MKKKILVEFDEQSKAVVCKTSVEYEFDTTDPPVLQYSHSNESISKEAQDLFATNQKFALERTMVRNR